MKKSDFYSQGFTLLELMLVIVILGVLVLLISGNFFTSLKKGRDARRKTDLKEIKNALELYYQDYGEYPEPTYMNFGSSFSRGNKTYFQKLPQDPLEKCSYKYMRTDSQTYYLLSTIENSQDSGPGVSQTGYRDPNNPGVNLDCSASGLSNQCICRFYVGSPNAVLTPVP